MASFATRHLFYTNPAEASAISFIEVSIGSTRNGVLHEKSHFVMPSSLLRLPLVSSVKISNPGFPSISSYPGFQCDAFKRFIECAKAAKEVSIPFFS